MKILVASDKFKGSLSSIEATSTIGEFFKKKGYQVFESPLADGGEGTVEAIVSAVSGDKRNLTVKDPLFRDINSFFGLINEGEEAVIEMAAASGLYLLSPNEKNPLKTTTFGTGELIKATLNKGVKKIIIGVGGSATNDGGLGAARALGVRFFDSKNRELEVIGENLVNVYRIDLRDIDKRLKNTELIVAVDVENSFYGKEGAAYIYGPQKGANEAMVKELDVGLRNLAAVVKKQLAINLQNIKGSGAAGGLAGGLVAFLGARITGGTDFICNLLNLDKKILQVDLVVSGEGRVDEQTLYGKAPYGVIKLAKKANKKVVLISGSLGYGWQKIEEENVKIYPLSTNNSEMEASIKNPKPAIEKAVEQIINDLR